MFKNGIAEALKYIDSQEKNPKWQEEAEEKQQRKVQSLFW